MSYPLKARVIVEGALSRLHRAAVHGASVEFVEHKEYSPGDELRHDKVGLLACGSRLWAGDCVMNPAFAAGLGQRLREIRWNRSRCRRPRCSTRS